MKQILLRKNLLFILLAIFLLNIFCANHAFANQNYLSEALSSSTSETWMLDLWKFSLSAVNIIIIGVLIFLAIVNILHIQYDTYEIKKYLLPLLVAVILANFSLFICRALIEFTQALTNSIFGDVNKVVNGLYAGLHLDAQDLISWVPAVASTTIKTGIGAVIGIPMLLIYLLIGVIISVILSIAILLSSLIFFVRVYVILILAGLAPIAFVLSVIPATQGLFKQWMGWFMKFAFMGPLMALFFRIAGLIGNSGSQSKLGSIIIVFMIIVLLILAFLTPLMLSLGILSLPGMKQLGGVLGKQATKFAEGNATLAKVKGYFGGAQEFRKSRADTEYQKAAAISYEQAQKGVLVAPYRAAKQRAQEAITEGAGPIGAVGAFLKGEKTMSAREQAAISEGFAKQNKASFSSAAGAKKFFDELKNSKIKLSAEIVTALKLAKEGDYLNQEMMDQAWDYANKTKGINKGEVSNGINSVIMGTWDQDIDRKRKLSDFKNPGGNNKDLAKYIAENADAIKNPDTLAKSLSGNIDTITSYLKEDTTSATAKSLIASIAKARTSAHMDPDAIAKLQSADNLVAGIDEIGSALSAKKIPHAQDLQASLRKTITSNINLQGMSPNDIRKQAQEFANAVRAIKELDSSFDPTNKTHIDTFFDTSNKSFSKLSKDDIEDVRNKFYTNISQVGTHAKKYSAQIIAGGTV